MVNFQLSDEHSRPHLIVVNPWGYFYPFIAYHLKKGLKNIDYTFDLLNVALKVEWCQCYFVICCRMMTGNPNLNMNGHQKTFGKTSTPVSFLTHQMNQRRKSNRLVINFGKRKQSIIFLEFGNFLGKKPEKKNIAFKKVWFFSAFQEFTYYKLKLREQEMCFVSQQFQAVIFFQSRFHEN